MIVFLCLAWPTCTVAIFLVLDVAQRRLRLRAARARVAAYDDGVFVDLRTGPDLWTFGGDSYPDRLGVAHLVLCAGKEVRA
jgi:hypothetical protein